MGMIYAALVLLFVWAGDDSVNEHPPTPAEIQQVREQVELNCKQGKYEETLERIERCGK